MFATGIIGVQFPSLPQVVDCSASTLLSQRATECREIAALKAAENFPWDKQQADVQDFFRQFQTSVAADRREEVAGLMMYPLRVTYYSDRWNVQYRLLQSPSELLDVYEMVFHKSLTDLIANHDANEIWGNNVDFQTGSGEIGIHAKTLGDCPACSFEFKVESIRSNWIFRDPRDAIMDEVFKPGGTP